jgi:L-asparaginase
MSTAGAAGESPASTALPRVSVLSLGGTIASVADQGQAALVRISGPQLLDGVPEAADIAALRAHPVRLVPSGDLRMTDLFELTSMIGQEIEDGAEGIVVTQGTDTLEETSYALDLLMSTDVPIAVTGAMRNASLPGADGPANLLAAIRVAASPQARGLGTLVVFNDEIHAARHVRKSHTSSTATFRSSLTGPLGLVTEDRVRIWLRPAGRLHVPVPSVAPDVRVAQVTVSFDDDGRLLEAVPDLGYQGLVLAAFGGGHVPHWIVPVLARVAARIPVILATRTNCGEGLRATYAYPGAEMDLLAHGLIPAVSLDPAHAAVLLRLLLMAGVPHALLPWCFEQASDPPGAMTILDAIGHERTHSEGTGPLTTTQSGRDRS